MKNVFKLSLYNFAAYKKIYVKIICALIALLFLITLISSFTLSINSKQKELINSSIAFNYTFGSQPLSKDFVAESFETFEFKRILAENVFKEVFGGDKPYLTTDDFALDYGGERIYSDSSGVFDAYVAKDGIFTQNDYRQAGKDAVFMLGGYPQSANEIALAEFVLNFYGLTRDVLGKEITLTAVKREVKVKPSTPDVSGSDVISIPNFEYEYVELPFSMTVTVCGIITKDYYDMGVGFFNPSVLVTEDNALTAFGTEDCYLCSLDEWASKQTAKYFEDNEINYAGQGNLDRINVTVNLQTVVNQLVLYFASSLIFGIVLTLVLLCEKLCAAQMKNSGVLLMSGMTNGRLFCVWLVQFALSAAIALIAASLLTYGALIGINAIISRTFWLSLTVSAATFFDITAIGFAAVGIITVAALGYFAIVFRRKQTRELLDT